MTRDAYWTSGDDQPVRQMLIQLPVRLAIIIKQEGRRDDERHMKRGKTGILRIFLSFFLLLFYISYGKFFSTSRYSSRALKQFVYSFICPFRDVSMRLFRCCVMYNNFVYRNIYIYVYMYITFRLCIFQSYAICTTCLLIF